MEAFILDLSLSRLPFFDFPPSEVPSRHPHFFLTTALSYVTPCWWSHLGSFLIEYDITLRTTEDLPLPSLRLNDTFLMNAFILAGFRGHELARLQRCRLHLKAITLADIADGFGTSICPWAMEGQAQYGHHFRASYTWPKQPRPSSAAWAT